MATLMTPSKPISRTLPLRSKTFHHQCYPHFAVRRNVSVHGYGLRSSSHLGVVKISSQAQPLIDVSLTSSSAVADVPLLTCEEAIERMRLSRGRHKGKQEFLAMYSSVFGGITVDPAAMLIPMDVHMVHRGHGVFDTAAIVDGHLYELDQHLNRFLRRLSSFAVWMPSVCSLAVVMQYLSPPDHKGIKVITASVPIKAPMFAIVKSNNYLPNVLCQMEAEGNGCFASIWLDSDGFVAEGPNMNVAFVTKERELLMPKFDKILSGCTAKRLLTLSEELVKKGEIRKISVRDVTVDEGKRAEEMMLIGSGVLVRPVIQWDDQVIGNGKEGSVTQALLIILMEDMKSGPATVRIPVPYTE